MKMRSGQFESVAMREGHPDYKKAIRRFGTLYKKDGDIRSPFSRDYNRILHCKAYRRLKHKTQVFYATTNDHICTRIEHVNHVASVSYSIANFLGLNTELTGAIALGHDLGHAPFGHAGEYILRDLMKEQGGDSFWHEQNSLRFVDHLETLTGLDGKEHNMALTYAVRDGIISHCGEVNENAVFPRKQAMDLYKIERPNQYPPYTWEACVVKIADKISYLGRDIEDALTLGILSKEQLRELGSAVEHIRREEVHRISNTLLMHDFINNLCSMSSPDRGILFSPEYLEMINKVKEFNYRHIYLHPRLKVYNEYAGLVITSLFKTLLPLCSAGNKTEKELAAVERSWPELGSTFRYWLNKYSDFGQAGREQSKFANHIVYSVREPLSMLRALTDYLSSMTDQFIVKLFGELTRF